jgi:hypothetical protein
MGHWNYRVLKRDGGRGDHVFSIFEVFYDDRGRIYGWSADPVAPNGGTLNDLQEDFKRYRHALTRPVLSERRLLARVRPVPARRLHLVPAPGTERKAPGRKPRGRRER